MSKPAMTQAKEVKFPALTEEDFMPDPNHREKINNAYEELGFMKARIATYDFMEANPEATFTDVLNNVTLNK